MQIEVPIFRQISCDLKLSPRAFQIWRAAIELLDLVEWRELKQWEIEHTFDIDQSTVSRALSTLVEQGYLCRQDAIGRAAAKYRVPLSRRDCTDPTPVAQETETVAATEHAETASTRRQRHRVLSRGVL